MSACGICKREISDGEHMVDGQPAICAWVPYGAPKSVYSIVNAHLACMDVNEIQQALRCWEEETNKRGYPALIVIEAQKRLAKLLAFSKDMKQETNGKTTDSKRFSLMELD